MNDVCNPCSHGGASDSEECLRCVTARPEKPTPQPSVLSIAYGIVRNDRMDKYGPPRESFEQAGRIIGPMLTEGERVQIVNGGFPPSAIAKVMIALKLVRESYSPDNRDHLIDVCGYVDILDQVK